jgi:type II secretory pathway pseudopilin PulG
MKTGKRTRRNAALRRRDAGFSFIEVMIIAAILAVALTVFLTSVGTILAVNVRECAKNLTGELGKGKIAAMARAGEVYMRLYRTDSGVYIDAYENDRPVSSVPVGKASVAVTYFTESNTAGTLVDAVGIVIAFNRSGGGFKSVGEAWALYDASAAPAYAGEYYTKFVVSNGYGSKTIMLWPHTGKISYTG